MIRTIAAFLIAPLTVPAVVGGLGVMSFMMNSFDRAPIRNPFPDSRMIINFTVMAALLSYGGAIVFGVPGYIWLRKRGIDAFGAWPALGFGAGATTAFVTASWALLRMLVDPDLNPDHFPPLLGFLAFELFWVSLVGVFGAGVGMVHRLIAPPHERRSSR